MVHPDSRYIGVLKEMHFEIAHKHIVAGTAGKWI